ncbi:PTS system galactitol-specific IIA component [Enterococcus sp. PF1-24]|uniref:PTS sugar transporter subunit IIA n=1 Tax=unclassified Enterococcus TaxID=2608891 RepID=UPI0024755470|nr:MULTISPECIES: PTS sugar transporter subunit IIA [unclassified Enterococcus]MDH6364244.1 PTS system galactitol-specific IIA component [Enterococcus sp. PFB1-1]MDH6401397.1 PTS system galactitol-specific IIA component [Enterococcus sp. PF1-24]
MTAYFNQGISFFQQEKDSQMEIFTQLAEALLQQDLVNEHFLENVIKREEIFPTGLNINGIGVAIPHTDSEYVKTSQIAFMSVRKPIIFYEMGTTDKAVPVQLIFMLALKEAHEQLGMLQKLIEMFQQPKVLAELLAVKEQQDFQKIIARYDLI